MCLHSDVAISVAWVSIGCASWLSIGMARRHCRDRAGVVDQQWLSPGHRGAGKRQRARSDFASRYQAAINVPALHSQTRPR